MGVMFSVHGDSVRPILPPMTFSVGFEEEIVPGVTITPPNFEDMCEYLERPLPQNVVKNLTFYLQ